MSDSLTSENYKIDIESENIGAFIGAQGKNYKRIISEIKKKIFNKKEISKEEWESVKINLRFDNNENETFAVITDVESEYINFIKETLDKFVDLHKKESIKYEKKKNSGIEIVYRIGAEHRFIGKMIGFKGCNISKLKEDISNLENIEKVMKIELKEQNKRYNGNFRNIGKRNQKEHIMMFIYLKGLPELNKIQKSVEDFVEKNTTDLTEEEDEFDGGW